MLQSKTKRFLSFEQLDSRIAMNGDMHPLVLIRHYPDWRSSAVYPSTLDFAGVTYTDQVKIALILNLKHLRIGVFKVQIYHWLYSDPRKQKTNDR